MKTVEFLYIYILKAGFSQIYSWESRFEVYFCSLAVREYLVIIIDIGIVITVRFIIV